MLFALVLKTIAVLGAVVYAPIAIAYPLVGIIIGVAAPPTFFLLWFIAAFGLLTLLPNRVLYRIIWLRRAYVSFAVVATIIGAVAILERFSTHFYGMGMAPSGVVFLLLLFASLCCGWLSYWMFVHCESAASVDHKLDD